MHVLHIITGGIAAYKALEVIRLLKKRGHAVRPVLTRAAQQFVTPLSATALAGQRARSELFDADDEAGMDHIALARWADVVLVAPASADFMARAAHGLADDLATTLLLATTAPVLMAPAMNPRMWEHPATRRNVARLLADGVRIIDPQTGKMACGEEGVGRMAEPETIVARLEELLAALPATAARPLAGHHVLITSGPTLEPIDPVRVIANRSSGRMGHALAEAARDLGARVTLVSGPTCLPPPAGVDVVPVETARQMLEAVERALPADMAIFAAAVADWRVAEAANAKLKKTGDAAPTLTLVENPDILATIARHEKRPNLLVGFAAETHDLLENARAKLKRKGADVIIANDVSPNSGILGGEETELHLVWPDTVEHLPRQPKPTAARAVLERLAAALNDRLRD